MTTTKNEFQFVISAVDRATSALTSVRNQLNSVSEPIDRINRRYAHLKNTVEPLGDSLDDLSDKLQRVSDFTATRLALPTAAFGGYVLKQAADFEAATNKVKVLAGYAENFTEQAKSDMKSLEEMARTLGKELKFGPTDVMLGFGELLSNEPDVAKAKAMIKPTLNLSLAADMKPAEAAKLLNAVMAGFEGTSATQGANLLARLQAISSVKLPEFGETLSNVAGQAMLRGEDPTSLFAASAVLSRTLIDKSKAGSHLEIFYKRLSNSLVDENIQKAFAAMGIKKTDIFDQVDGAWRLKKMDELLPKFASVMNNPSLSKVFGEDAISTVLVLLKNLNKFYEYQNDLRGQLGKGDDNGSAALQAAVSSQGLKGSFEQLKGSIEEFSIALAKSGLLKEVTDIVMGATRLVDSLGKLDSQVLSAVTNLGALILATSGLLAVTAPLARFGGALAAAGGLGAAGAGTAAGGLGAAGAVGAGGAALSGGALFSALGAAAVVGGSSYLMTKDMGLKSGNPFLSTPQTRMSRAEFQTKLQAGMEAQRKEIYDKVITGADLSPGEMANALTYAQSLDPRFLAGDGQRFTAQAFSYGELLRKTRRGGRLTDKENAMLQELRLSRMAGSDVRDMVKPLQMPQGEIVVDFKNVPPGTDIKKAGANPAFDLKIEFARGPVMPGKGKGAQ